MPKPNVSGSIIAYANWFQFAAEERIEQIRVESRMLVWCERGCGSICVNGYWLEFAADHFALMPWSHAITYQADARSPFLLGAIHLIPFHDPNVAMEFMAAHQPTDRLAGVVWRHDVPWTGLHGLQHGIWNAQARACRLARYIVDRFQEVPPEEQAYRDLASLLILELYEFISQQPTRPPTPPGRLKQIQEYAKTHLDERLEVNVLAEIGECSPATLHRLFETYMNDTPAHWIARLRSERASYLLRTTNLSITKIGTMVGIHDPFQFSRLFKRHYGVSPKAYRQQHNT
jgi:AraC-like DNA-binding protein